MPEFVMITGGGSGYGQVLAQTYVQYALHRVNSDEEVVLYLLVTGRDSVKLHTSCETLRAIGGASLRGIIDDYFSCINLSYNI
jgi:short-subunit dehydrogenase involved in D-alanine esterification of teichoic acids